MGQGNRQACGTPWVEVTWSYAGTLDTEALKCHHATRSDSNSLLYLLLPFTQAVIANQVIPGKHQPSEVQRERLTVPVKRHAASRWPRTGRRQHGGHAVLVQP